MKWGNLYYLFLLFLIPFFGLLFFLLSRQRKKWMEAFADSSFWQKLMPISRPGRILAKQILWLMALLCFVVAFAEPRWGYHFEDVVRKGVDIFLLVDVSNSMMAEDVKPDRLERAKRKIYDLLKMSQGDRIGLIIFAGRAVVLSPLTLDYQSIHQFLETLSPDLIPIQGTDLSGAISLALKSFKDPKTQKALITFTDGEDHGPQMSKMVSTLKEQKIPLYILGFGTPEGAPIPLPKGEGGFKRDDAGNLVISKLAEKSLIQMASETGGEYVRSVTSDEDLNELYAKGLKGAMSGSEIKASKKRVYESRFQWPLGLGVLFLFFSYLISEVKVSYGSFWSRVRRSKAPYISLLLVVFLGFPAPAHAGVFSTFQKYFGWKAFENHDYSKAQEHFAESLVDNPKDSVSAYDLGNAYYRKGEYLKAAESFYKATESQEPKLKEKAVYNLGNSFYKSGQWENSIKSYEEALKIDPKDEEARLNLEFVKKKLQEKQQQESQQNQQKQSKGGEGQDQKQQGGSSSDQGQQNAKSQDQNNKDQKNKDPQNQDQQKQSQDQQKQENAQDQQKQDSQSQKDQQQQGAQNSQQQNQQQSPNSQNQQNPDKQKDQQGQQSPQENPSQNNQKQDSQNQNSKNQNNNPSQNSQDQAQKNQNQGQNEGKQGQDSKAMPQGNLELQNGQKNQKQEATGNMQVKGSGGDTTHQEAEQWLNTLQEDAAQILKNQIQKKIGKARRVEQDW